MRLLYVSRSSGIHDKKFIDAWESIGVHTKHLVFDDVQKDYAAELTKAISTFGPDAIQVGPITFPGRSILGGWSGPLIATSWGFDLLYEIEKDVALKFSAQRLLSRADVIFVDNQAVEETALKLGATSGKIRQFPWGSDEFWLTGRRSNDVNFLRPKIVCTRSHEPIYGVADVISAFALSAAFSKGGTLTLVGAGSQTDELRDLARDLGAENAVNFVGRKNAKEMQLILRSHDLYVSNSMTDGTSISLLEAMSSEIPVLVSDIVGNKQWVSKQTGSLFAQGNVDELRLAINSFMYVDDATKELVVSRVKEARNLVTRAARWETVVARFQGYLQDAVSMNRTDIQL